MKALLVPGQGKIAEQLIHPGSAEKKYWLSCAEDYLGQKFTADALLKHDVYSAAIMADTLGIFEQYRKLGGTVDMTAGYSVGQFGALAIAGAISFEEAINTVILRARIMQKHLVKGTGMLSLIGLDQEKVGRLLDQVNANFDDPLEKAYVSNVNSAFNFTVAGKKATLQACFDKAQEMECKACRMLEVEGAWHSPYQQPAADDYSRLLDKLNFKPLSTVFVCNVTGEEVSDLSAVKEQLLLHLFKPVQWQKTMATLKAIGAKAYIGCGNGDQLSKMLFFMRIRPFFSMTDQKNIEQCAAL